MEGRSIGLHRIEDRAAQHRAARSDDPDQRQYRPHQRARGRGAEQSDADRRDLRRCVAIARDIAGQAAFDGLRKREMDPGPEIKTDGEIDAYVRAHATTAFHLAGTCRMGDSDTSVVDAQARVHGIERLRVVDASIMPSIPSGNLNAPVMMMAEKVADLIRSDASC